MEKSQKMQVKGGKYIGKKWFLKLPYKTIETEIDFEDEEVSILQGAGFTTANNKIRTNIRYKDITSVTSKRKFSLPNMIFAIIWGLLAIIMEVPELLIVAAIALFIGKTAQVKIDYAGQEYIVPTEFMSDAQDLETRINTAIVQARS